MGLHVHLGLGFRVFDQTPELHAGPAWMEPWSRDKLEPGIGISGQKISLAQNVLFLLQRGGFRV